MDFSYLKEISEYRNDLIINFYLKSFQYFIENKDHMLKAIDGFYISSYVNSVLEALLYLKEIRTSGKDIKSDLYCFRLLHICTEVISNYGEIKQYSLDCLKRARNVPKIEKSSNFKGDVFVEFEFDGTTMVYTEEAFNREFLKDIFI